ncbi:Ig-like domain-containing protein [Enterococcus ureilyticus]|uniref:Ig-like domain-containing protein n=1 Tax=Enterococcus ureilyticus TaxID=1131292 RepID=UPI001A90EF96|nr:Ig-like domain-containing protein [Enterococcus ureilyticus]MBO0445152.1 Ig-like domain-containing protein [Enterococcus ureilyticus]
MKKRFWVGIVAIGLLVGVGSHVYAEELKEPTIADVVGEGLQPGIPEKIKKARTTKAATEVVYVPAEEVEKIKAVQQSYQDVVADVKQTDKFSTLPVLANGTYTLGEFKTEVVEKAAEQVNFYRTLAGVSPIPFAAESTEYTQHAAIGMAAIQKQTHYLDTYEKPADMPEEFWLTANKASRQSNIHSNQKEASLNSHQDAFVVDWGKGNKTVGHRTGMLSLSGVDMGFGYAKANQSATEASEMNYFTSTYIRDDYKGISTRYENDTIVQWPSSGIFPYELYNVDNPYMANSYKENMPDLYEKNMRWSVHFNEKGYKLTDKVAVTLTNQATGKSTVISNDADGGELTLENPKPGYYARGGYVTVVFRPNNNYTIEKNDVYKVEITGIEKAGTAYTHVYETRFAGMNDTFKAEVIPVKEIVFDSSVDELEVGEKAKIEASVRPENATNKTLVWKSSDENIATVDQAGEVKALKAGKVVIKVETEDGTVRKEQMLTVYNERVNINYADYDELQKIIGFDEDNVNDFIWERYKGFFHSIDDLSRVEWIDAALIKKIKDQGIAYVPAKFNGVFPAKIANIFEDPSMGNGVANSLGLSVYDTVNREDLLSLNYFGASYLEVVHSFSGIEYLGNLNRLFVYTDVTEFSWTKFIPELEELNLFGDVVGGNPVDMENTLQVDATGLANLKKLKRLELSESYIHDLRFINELPMLERLEVFRMVIEQMPQIETMEYLESISIGDSRFKDISWMKDLKDLSDLTFWLSHNELTDISGLANLEKIGSLNLSNNNISDISSLANLKEFYSLNLRNNQIENVDVFSQLAIVNEIDLSRNKLTNITGFSKLEQASTLNLSHNQLTDISPLQNLKKASVLDLSNNQITDRSPLNGSGKSFYYLYLNNNPLK